MATTNNYHAPVAYGAHIFIGDGVQTSAQPPGAWIYAGPARTITIEPQTQTHEWFVPTMGVKYRSGFLEWQTALDFRASIIYAGVALWALLLRNNTEIPIKQSGASTLTYAPLRDPNLYAWVQVQYYDTADNLQNVIQLWSHLCIESGPDLGDGGVEYEIMGRQLHSPAQSGQLQTFATA